MESTVSVFLNFHGSSIFCESFYKIFQFLKSSLLRGFLRISAVINSVAMHIYGSDD